MIKLIKLESELWLLIYNLLKVNITLAYIKVALAPLPHLNYKRLTSKFGQIVDNWKCRTDRS